MPTQAAIEYEDCGRSAKRYAAFFPKDPDAGALFGYVRSESRLLSQLLGADGYSQLLRLARRHGYGCSCEMERRRRQAVGQAVGQRNRS